MKIIFKTLIILVVATIIASVFYEAVTTFSSESSLSEFSERMPERQNSDSGDFIPPNRDRESGGFGFPIDSIKNFIIIAVVCVGYLFIKKFLSKKKSLLPA